MAIITPPEAPVFLDESGRRARRVRWGARAAAALMPAWLMAIVIGALNPLGLPALPVEIASSRAPTARAVASSRTPTPTAVASSRPATGLHFARLTAVPTSHAAGVARDPDERTPQRA